MQKIIIQNEASTKADGHITHGNRKPVYCIDTGEIFASATDAAEANGITVYSVSMNCLGKTKRSNGKRFCYIKNTMENLEEISMVVREANAKANELTDAQSLLSELAKAEADCQLHKGNCEALQEQLARELNLLREAEERRSHLLSTL